MKWLKVENWFGRREGERASGPFSAEEAAQEAQIGRWSSFVPYLLATTLISAALVIGVLHATGGTTQKVVVFDILKYANAQRVVAERLVGRRESEEAASILLDLSQKTRLAIQEVAGADALVVIRQAIVRGETRDITDEVLRRLGLPTQVPTADATQHVFDVAPTLLGSGPRMVIEAPSARPSADILP